MQSFTFPRIVLLTLALGLLATQPALANGEHGSEQPDLRPAKGGPAYLAILNAGQVPESEGLSASPALGVAFFTYARSERLLCYTLSFTPLTATETKAHVHAGAVGEVRKPHLWDLAPVPATSKRGCVGPLERAHLKLLKRGQLYVNIHTEAYPNGEIRGQIVPVKGVR